MDSDKRGGNFPGLKDLNGIEKGYLLACRKNLLTTIIIYVHIIYHDYLQHIICK